MADTFDEFAECDEGYGDSVPTAKLDAEGFPQVIAPTARVCFLRDTATSRSSLRLYPSKTSASFATSAPMTAAAFSSALLFFEHIVLIKPFRFGPLSFFFFLRLTRFEQARANEQGHGRSISQSCYCCHPHHRPSQTQVHAPNFLFVLFLTCASAPQLPKHAPRSALTWTVSLPLQCARRPIKKVQASDHSSSMFPSSFSARKALPATSALNLHPPTPHPSPPVIAAEHLPAPKSLATASKRFFFDMFSNDRGVYDRPIIPSSHFNPTADVALMV